MFNSFDKMYTHKPCKLSMRSFDIIIAYSQPFLMGQILYEFELLKYL